MIKEKAKIHITSLEERNEGGVTPGLPPSMTGTWDKREKKTKKKRHFKKKIN